MVEDVRKYLRERWLNRDVISILDFSKEDLLFLFRITDEMNEIMSEGSEVLKGKVIATAFFEPSTRTRLSFETAAYKLGASVITFTPDLSSLAKGESLADTFRMLDGYADVIIVRSPLEGTAKMAAEVCESPVINGGDGTQHHPTQAMIDLYTIRTVKGNINGLNVGVLGDLKYGRAATSFIFGLLKFNVNSIWLISPEELRIREDVRLLLEKYKPPIHETTDLEEALPELDVLYVTRIQKERFPDPAEYERVKGSYIVKQEVLKKAKDDLIILHPLPRVDELPYEVDKTPYAAYFKQAHYGVPVRMALLALVLGRLPR